MLFLFPSGLLGSAQEKPMSPYYAAEKQLPPWLYSGGQHETEGEKKDFNFVAFRMSLSKLGSSINNVFEDM